MCRKVYVSVNVDHYPDGRARPNSIQYEDGRLFSIDRIKNCCRAASTKVGGTGLRYTICICNHETYLFDEQNGKWFVEA